MAKIIKFPTSEVRVWKYKNGDTDTILEVSTPPVTITAFLVGVIVGGVMMLFAKVTR